MIIKDYKITPLTKRGQNHILNFISNILFALFEYPLYGMWTLLKIGNSTSNDNIICNEIFFKYIIARIDNKEVNVYKLIDILQNIFFEEKSNIINFLKRFLININHILVTEFPEVETKYNFNIYQNTIISPISQNIAFVTNSNQLSSGYVRFPLKNTIISPWCCSSYMHPKKNTYNIEIDYYLKYNHLPYNPYELCILEHHINDICFKTVISINEIKPSEFLEDKKIEFICEKGLLYKKYMFFHMYKDVLYGDLLDKYKEYYAKLLLNDRIEEYNSWEFFINIINIKDVIDKINDISNINFNDDTFNDLNNITKDINSNYIIFEKLYKITFNFLKKLDNKKFIFNIKNNTNDENIPKYRFIYLSLEIIFNSL